MSSIPRAFDKTFSMIYPNSIQSFSYMIYVTISHIQRIDGSNFSIDFNLKTGMTVQRWSTMKCYIHMLPAYVMCPDSIHVVSTEVDCKPSLSRERESQKVEGENDPLKSWADFFLKAPL